MQPMQRNILTLLLSLLLLAGCVSPPAVRNNEQPSNKPSLTQQAVTLEQGGDYAAAAKLFEQIASGKHPPLRQSLLLRAVDNYLKAGDKESASRLLDSADARVHPALDFRRRLLLAEQALDKSRPDKALKLLETAPPIDTDPALVRRYHRIRAEGFRLSGNLLESARELGRLDLLLVDVDAKLANQQSIIQTLTTLTDTALELLQPSPPGVQGGWMELARIIKANAIHPGDIQSQLAGWLERFPSHPAMPELLDGYLQKLKAQYIRPNHLAVMLPMSGPYANAARAILDGFIAAYYEERPENRPRLVFYDNSNSADTWPLYRAAVQSGADMVIGPLDKESVAQMARAGELDIPVLALNQVPPEVAPPADLYQFGLSPEDEARQVAEKAWLDGHTRAVVLTPQGRWGDRLFSAFANRWERLGGLIAEHQRYNPKVHDFKQPIRAMLNIDESYARRKEIQRLLGKKVEFEPRRRADADFIFLAAKVNKARQIRPQLQFHHAADMPVYTTSHIFSGKTDLKQDLDLEGLLFPDIPWLLVSEANDPLSRQNIAEIIPGSRNSYRRLYALGIDSYRLLPHLARLQTSPTEMLAAKTGNLYLDDINHVHRQLVWAQMRGGSPRVLGYAPRMDFDIGELPPQVEVMPSIGDEATPTGKPVEVIDRGQAETGRATDKPPRRTYTGG